MICKKFDVMASAFAVIWLGAGALGHGAVPTSSSQPAPSSGPQLAAPAVTADYVIGPGDELQVFVWRNAELTVLVPVRPDGKISTPLNEDMPAVGKTPMQLARDIEKVLSVYVRSPQVNIIVTKPVSAFSQVKVIGQVLHPALGAISRRYDGPGCGARGGWVGEFRSGQPGAYRAD